MSRIDHYYTDDIVCPHCGYVNRDSWEYDDNDGVIECPECCLPFSYERIVSCTYSTAKEAYEVCGVCGVEDVLVIPYFTDDGIKVCNECYSSKLIDKLKSDFK